MISKNFAYLLISSVMALDFESAFLFFATELLLELFPVPVDADDDELTGIIIDVESILVFTKLLAASVFEM